MQKFKAIASYILFYGAEHLEASIKSIEPFVDSIVILFTNHPTQGHGTHLKSPDADIDMKSICLNASSKVKWVDVSNEPIAHEGDHRNQIYKYITDEDCLIMVDPDEIFEPLDIENAIKQCMESGRRECGVKGYYHFWRSYDYCLTDGFRPIRFHNLHIPFVSTDPKGEVECRIYHMSLCQRAKTIEHKFQTFGHANDMRQNYFQDVWNVWKPDSGMKYLHPCSMGCWVDVEPFDKTTLPDVLKQHENYNKTWETRW